jgi:hydrogenase maturation factor HypF (carbamoyltransferase family)
MPSPSYEDSPFGHHHPVLAICPMCRSIRVEHTGNRSTIPLTALFDCPDCGVRFTVIGEAKLTHG